jgi:hypothetical protein
MKQWAKRLGLAAVVVLLMTCLGAACGGGEEEEGSERTPTTTEEATSERTPTTTEEAGSEGDLVKLTTESVKVYDLDDPQLDIVGEGVVAVGKLENKTDRSVTAEVSAVLFGRGNKVLETEETSADLPPKGKGYVVVDWEKPADYDRVEMVLGDQYDSLWELYSDFEIADICVRGALGDPCSDPSEAGRIALEEEDLTLWLTGTVRNTGDKAVRGVELDMLFLDKDGKVLDKDYGYPELLELAPGQESAIKTTIESFGLLLPEYRTLEVVAVGQVKEE